MVTMVKRGPRRFIVWGRQNPTDVISRPGDFIGLGRRVVIAPHAPAPASSSLGADLRAAAASSSLGADLRAAAVASQEVQLPKGRGRPRNGGKHE